MKMNRDFHCANFGVNYIYVPSKLTILGKKISRIFACKKTRDRVDLIYVILSFIVRLQYNKLSKRGRADILTKISLAF